MAYGYAQWKKHESTDSDGNAIPPEKAALQKVLDVVDNLTYPQPGWGMIDRGELSERLASLKGGDETNADWEKGIALGLDQLEGNEFLEFNDKKIDPKVIVDAVKKRIKEIDAG